ncbi:2695_t:CDS:2, partial [Entrophospora sp. SA101]
SLQWIQCIPFNQEKDQLKKRVSAAPETLPKKMQVGQSLDNNNPLASVRKISEAFSNTDRIAYYSRQIINEENIITKTARRHGDNFILDILQFQQDHPNFIRKTDFANK